MTKKHLSYNNIADFEYKIKEFVTIDCPGIDHFEPGSFRKNEGEHRSVHIVLEERSQVLTTKLPLKMIYAGSLI